MDRDRMGTGALPQHDEGTAPRQRIDGVSLTSLFLTFLKIGSTAFGGFMALISIVQHYAVDRRKWLAPEDMLDGVSLATILPGPVAVNVVAYVGYRMRGLAGAVVSASAVILPAFLLLLGLSYVYFQFGQVPAAGKLFQGFVPAVAGIILVAAWNMGVKAVRGRIEAFIALAAAVLLLGIGGFWVTIAIVAASGLAGWLLFPGTPAQQQSEPTRSSGRKPGRKASQLQAVAAGALPVAPALGLNAGLLLNLALTFGGMSLLLFGGGYVFIPLIQRIVVDTYSWVTRQEFIDAIALGQVTPGPILISATFIGYKVAGVAGAAVATAGIFTPAALCMLLCTRFLDRIKRSRAIVAGLRGIRPAVIGMIVAAGVTVARTAPVTGTSLLIFGGSLIALLRFKVETAWIIPAAGVIGFLLY
jgi:chromate transporter